MAKATVHSKYFMCGVEHVIEGKRAGENISIDIISPCEKI